MPADPARLADYFLPPEPGFWTWQDDGRVLVWADGMTIAGNLSDRRPMEVAYHGEHAYGMNVRRMDSHGGWIGSAADLIKFAHTVDGIRVCRRHRPPGRGAFS